MVMFSHESKETLWYAAHTHPRCEKKLAAYCEREGISATLLCFKSIKRYSRKVVEFKKPLFPGYLFFRGESTHAHKIYQSQYTANVLAIFDQNGFEQQLNDILRALNNGCLIAGVIDRCFGKEVLILNGPLAGMIGTVAQIAYQTTVVLRLDFIGQGAAIIVDSSNIHIVG